MPAPTSATELVELIQKSGVVDAARLTAYIQAQREKSTPPEDPKSFATQLIQDGVLTYFQAEQFLLGKWKRFTIGKYKVLERLGHGGMGQVFLCEHKHMRRRVAVKVLPTAKAEDPAHLERFYREARAVAALDHPNLVRAFDIDQDETLHFLVMEFVDGPSLQEIVRRSGALDPIRACHYVAQAADGLQYAYEVAGLVHRDVKPANILVDRSGLVKVLDMGLARFFNDEDDILTKKYDENVLGTADYLSPEQAQDSHGVTIAADIYSLGATFYFMLAGRPPFVGGTVAQKLIAHQMYAPESLRSLRPEVPDAIVAVVERMMMKNPVDRFQAPVEIAVALAPYTQVPIPPPSEDELPRLSLAAMGSSSGSSTAASGRYSLPRPLALGQRLSVPLSASRMPPPAPSTKPLSSRVSPAVAPPPSSPAARPGLASPSVGVVARSGRKGDPNPFATLLAASDRPISASPSSQNVYATAASRVASLSATALQPTKRKSVSTMAILALIAAFLCAAGGIALWKLVVNPESKSTARVVEPLTQPITGS